MYVSRGKVGGVELGWGWLLVVVWRSGFVYFFLIVFGILEKFERKIGVFEEREEDSSYCVERLF